MTLATCGRTSTLLSAATVPVASRMTSTSRCWTATVLTLTGGPLRAGCRRRAAAAPPPRRSRPALPRTCVAARDHDRDGEPGDDAACSCASRL
jgi:hypothetical protein